MSSVAARRLILGYARQDFRILSALDGFRAAAPDTPTARTTLSASCQRIPFASEHQTRNAVAEKPGLGAFHQDPDVVEIKIGPSRICPVPVGFLPRIGPVLPAEIHELAGHAGLRLNLRLAPRAPWQNVTGVIGIAFLHGIAANGLEDRMFKIKLLLPIRDSRIGVVIVFGPMGPLIRPAPQFRM